MTETNIQKDSDGRLTKCLYERNGYLVAKLYGTETKECRMKWILRSEYQQNVGLMEKLHDLHYKRIGCHNECDGFDSTRGCYTL